MKGVLVAYSGGVDSTLLLKVALDVLGKPRPGRHRRVGDLSRQGDRRAPGRWPGASRSVPGSSDTRELDNPDFAANPPERCYHCKKELFGTLAADRPRGGDPVRPRRLEPRRPAGFPARGEGRPGARGAVPAPGSRPDQGRDPGDVPAPRAPDLEQAVPGLPGLPLSLRYAGSSRRACGRSGRPRISCGGWASDSSGSATTGPSPGSRSLRGSSPGPSSEDGGREDRRRPRRTGLPLRHAGPRRLPDGSMNETLARGAGSEGMANGSVLERKGIKKRGRKPLQASSPGYMAVRVPKRPVRGPFPSSSP